MAFPKHQRTTKGTFRKERGDSTAKKLKQEYPELKKLTGKAGRARTLTGMKKALDVDSLDQVRKIARQKH